MLKLPIRDIETCFTGIQLDSFDLCADARERAQVRRDNAATIAGLVGQRFYVIEKDRLYDRSRRPTSYCLVDEPGRTNMSHEPRVKGWLGSTDNVSARALGYYEVAGQSSTHVHLREVPLDNEGE